MRIPPFFPRMLMMWKSNPECGRRKPNLVARQGSRLLQACAAAIIQSIFCLRSLCFLCADQHDSAKLDPLGVASELIPSSSHLPPIQPKSALSDRTDFADESSIGVLPLSTSSRRKKGLKDHLKNLDDDASSSTRPRRYMCRAFCLFTRCLFL